MAKIQILQKLANTKIDCNKSKEMLGKIIKQEFDKEKNENRAFELLFLAFKWNIPQFNEMVDDYEITDFKWF
jgi:RNase adaptor protein for sRNA GlmZ degradation